MLKLTNLIIKKTNAKEKGRKNTVTNVIPPVEISNTTFCRGRVIYFLKNRKHLFTWGITEIFENTVLEKREMTFAHFFINSFFINVRFLLLEIQILKKHTFKSYLIDSRKWSRKDFFTNSQKITPFMFWIPTAVLSVYNIF